jgi:hypothetical protein
MRRRRCLPAGSPRSTTARSGRRSRPDRSHRADLPGGMRTVENARRPYPPSPPPATGSRHDHAGPDRSPGLRPMRHVARLAADPVSAQPLLSFRPVRKWRFHDRGGFFAHMVKNPPGSWNAAGRSDAGSGQRGHTGIPARTRMAMRETPRACGPRLRASTPSRASGSMDTTGSARSVAGERLVDGGDGRGGEAVASRARLRPSGSIRQPKAARRRAGLAAGPAAGFRTR